MEPFILIMMIFADICFAFHFHRLHGLLLWGSFTKRHSNSYIKKICSNSTLWQYFSRSCYGELLHEKPWMLPITYTINLNWFSVLIAAIIAIFLSASNASFDNFRNLILFLGAKNGTLYLLMIILGKIVI